MNFKKTISCLVATLLLCQLFIGSALAQISNPNVGKVPGNWQSDIELKPLNEDHKKDVINLVPKQSVMMKVYVWFPATQTWIVKYPDWDMPGASIEKITTTVANLEREHNGLAQYGHTQNYIVTPVDIGTLELTQKSIDVSPTKDGSEIVPLSNPIQLNVTLPDGVYSIERFLPAYTLDVEQSFYLYSQSDGVSNLNISDVNDLTLRKGQLLERRITTVATGIKGSSIPEILTLEVPQRPQKESHYKDISGIYGFEGGERVDSFFYSPGEGSKVAIDDINIEWWDLKREQLKNYTLPGVSFASEKVEVYENEIALSWWEKNDSSVIIWGGISLVVAVFTIISVLSLNRVIKHAYGLFCKSLTHFSKSEPMLFTKLLLSLTINQKNKAKIHYIKWQYRLGIKSSSTTLNNYFYSECQVADNIHIYRISIYSVVRECLKLRRTILVSKTFPPIQLTNAVSECFSLDLWYCGNNSYISSRATFLDDSISQVEAIVYVCGMVFLHV